MYTVAPISSHNWTSPHTGSNMTYPDRAKAAKEDESLRFANDLLIDLSLGKIHGHRAEVSNTLYRSVLLQNTLNRRLEERMQGIRNCQRRRDEIKFLVKQREFGFRETAPWAAGSRLDDDTEGDMDDDMQQDKLDVNMESDDMVKSFNRDSNVKPRSQGQVPVRIKLVLKQKRSREEASDTGTEAISKRHCAESWNRAESATPMVA